MGIILALGANLPSRWGKPAETLSQALEILSHRVGGPFRCSAFYATPAFPAGTGPEFVNAVVALDVEIAPEVMLDICHDIEAMAKRKRDLRWGPRTLDIDLIAYNDRVLPDQTVHRRWRTLPEGEQGQVTPDRLILPHPRLQDRAFVLVPMMDVAPDWKHPVLGQTTAEMLARLPKAAQRAVRPLEPL